MPVTPERGYQVGGGPAIRGIDHVRFLVGSARQTAYFYGSLFGLDIIAYAGLETNSTEETAYVLRQGKVTFVFASPLTPDHQAAPELLRHGDGVKDIAFEVENVVDAYEGAVHRGARGIRSPAELRDQYGVLEVATIAAYGDTTHSFVNRDRYRGPFAPGYAAPGPECFFRKGNARPRFVAIDHIVANVERGTMDDWVRFYEEVLGFTQLAHFSAEDVGTEHSALMSKVMHGCHGRIRLPINEPADGRWRSQIQEFLEFYRGPGVQHIALTTNDIVATVRAMKANEVAFLDIPRSYYDGLPSRVGKLRANAEDLAELGILADRDDEGYMLQIFTQPVADRPTLFFEVIERRGARGFGKGNFRTLFAAIEREQARRGTH